MNAGRFVIDGLAIPANRKAQRYREYPISPAPGSVGLARSLFSYSNLGGGGRLACGVRGSAAGFESCVHTSKTIVRGGTLSAVHTVLVLVRRSRARHSRFRGPPPPSGFANFDQSRNWNDAVYTEIRETMSLDCAQCLDSVVR